MIAFADNNRIFASARNWNPWGWVCFTYYTSHYKQIYGVVNTKIRKFAEFFGGVILLVPRLKELCNEKGVSFIQSVMQKISLSDRNIRERYYELTRQERQMLWRNMVESIVVRGNVVDITWR